MDGRNILVTGGAGFIGSALVRYLIRETEERVCVVDKLTYAGNLESLAEVSGSDRFRFERADICDRAELDRIFSEFRPDAVMHLAAESHVDRSIDAPGDFIRTNIVGTYTLLEAARNYWSGLPAGARERFRFHHISTDEVFGDLKDSDGFFREDTPYMPSSPYSASKASSDHLVRAWFRTFGMPTLVTNCSNNYGPRQFPEKLIPLMILSALDDKPLPVYGDGAQVRDWLYVEDHARALHLAVTRGVPGETYNIGSQDSITIGDLAREVIRLTGSSSAIELVPYEKAYAKGFEDMKRRMPNTAKITALTGWKPELSLERIIADVSREIRERNRA